MEGPACRGRVWWSGVLFQSGFSNTQERGRVAIGAGSVELNHVYLPHVTALVDFVVQSTYGFVDLHCKYSSL
jgi:hypothetical protein